MAYATRRRRRGARSKRLWQSMIRRLRGPQLSVDDLRTFEEAEADGRDRTDSATQLQAQDAAERPDSTRQSMHHNRARRRAADLDAPVDALQPGALTLDAHGHVAVEDANKLDYGYRLR